MHKRLIARTCAALTLWSLSAAAYANTTYYVSKVAKNSVTTFVARMALPDAHIVVTKAPVFAAARSIQVDVANDERLVLEELFQSVMPPEKGELARFDNVAVLRIPYASIMKGHPTHVGHNVWNYTLVVEDKEVTLSPNVIAAPVANGSSKLDFQVDEEFLRQKLSQLSGDQDVTVNGRTTRITERGSSAGRQLARQFLAQEYAQYGFQASEQKYGRDGVNFYAEKKGQDASKVLIVSAHLDSMSNAGADDDGSGIIAGLALAKALQNAQLKYTVRIVGFDQEELGLVGSEAYVKYLVNQGEIRSIIGVLNVEMVGYDGDNDGAIHVIDCNENTSANLTNAFLSYMQASNSPLHKVNACTNRSDHASFWTQDVPAIVISQNFFGGDSNPCYHARCDKVDRVNFSYMKATVTALIGTVAQMVSAY